MTFQQIKSMIESFGIAYTYHEWTCPAEDVPALPWAVFRYPNITDFYADNKNYQRVTALEIELCTENKDFGLEQTVEGILANNGLTYTKTEDYFDTERMFDVRYELEVIIT